MVGKPIGSFPQRRKLGSNGNVSPYSEFFQTPHDYHESTPYSGAILTGCTAKPISVISSLEFTTMAFLKLYGLVLAIFLVLDLVWLGVVMKEFYSREMGELARRNGVALAPRWAAAIPVYLLIPLGIVVFVRPLIGDGEPLSHAFGWGALYGLILYGVYDLTNLAVIEKWTVRMTVADMIWGCLLCGTNSVTMVLIRGVIHGI